MQVNRPENSNVTSKYTKQDFNKNTLKKSTFKNKFYSFLPKVDIQKYCRSFFLDTQIFMKYNTA